MLGTLVAQVLHIGRRSWQLTSSRLRIVSLQLSYPGLIVRDSNVGPQCDIRLGRGARVLLDGVTLTRGITLIAAPGATVDIRADYVGPGCVLVARSQVEIGRGTMIGEYAVVRDANHDHNHPLVDHRYQTAPVSIGEDVWIGAHAVVLKGVHIGDSATIGAQSVVTHDVAPRSSVVGAPARPTQGTSKGRF